MNCKVHTILTSYCVVHDDWANLSANTGPRRSEGNEALWPLQLICGPSYRCATYIHTHHSGSNVYSVISQSTLRPSIPTKLTPTRSNWLINGRFEFSKERGRYKLSCFAHALKLLFVSESSFWARPSSTDSPCKSVYKYRAAGPGVFGVCPSSILFHVRKFSELSTLMHKCRVPWKQQCELMHSLYTVVVHWRIEQLRRRPRENPRRADSQPLACVLDGAQASCHHKHFRWSVELTGGPHVRLTKMYTQK